MATADLPPELARLVRDARRATLATIRPDGRPRLVPVCYVVMPPGRVGPGSVVYTPIDEKPKRTVDPLDLARVRDILAHPQVELLVDRWDEDWTRLAWVRLEGTTSVMMPAQETVQRTEAMAALREKYEQYQAHGLEDRPLLRIEVERTAVWSARAALRPGAG